MKCPHCLEHYLSTPLESEIAVPDGSKDDGFVWRCVGERCQSCGGSDLTIVQHSRSGRTPKRWRVWPKGAARPIGNDVPTHYTEDFQEACAVLPDSAKASAALSRRCLQMLLHDEFGIKIGSGDLAKEIVALLATGRLPPYIADVVDGVRLFGNFAAHPIPDGKTGEITDVEPEEAEWCLDVVESLFDFCFVQPAKTKAKKDALNEKQAAANKPPMQEPPTS